MNRRKRERERKRKRQTEREKDKEGQRQRHRDRERETQREIERKVTPTHSPTLIIPRQTSLLATSNQSYRICNIEINKLTYNSQHNRQQ